MDDEAKKKKEDQEKAALEAELLRTIGATATVAEIAPGSAQADTPPPTGVYTVIVDPAGVTLGRSTSGGPMITLDNLRTDLGRRVGRAWLTLPFEGQTEGGRRYSLETLSRVLQANDLPAGTTVAALLAHLRSGKARIYAAFSNALEMGATGCYDEIQILDKASFDQILKNPKVYPYKMPSRAKKAAAKPGGGASGGASGGDAANDDIPF